MASVVDALFLTPVTVPHHGILRRVFCQPLFLFTPSSPPSFSLLTKGESPQGSFLLLILFMRIGFRFSTQSALIGSRFHRGGLPLAIRLTLPSPFMLWAARIPPRCGVPFLPGQILFPSSSGKAELRPYLLDHLFPFPDPFGFSPCSFCPRFVHIIRRSCGRAPDIRWCPPPSSYCRRFPVGWK